MPDRAGHVDDSRHNDTSRSLRIARTPSAGVGDRPHDIATVYVGSPLGNMDPGAQRLSGMLLLHVRPGAVQKVMYISLAGRAD